ncbi:alpha/beta fold hydrolase [Lentzea xinjiangensis]|nr:alpha/beta fold hydrolase [Lentzea xinjiangensis]
MAGFAERAHARVLLPTHPGFGGTPKPAGLTGVADLALAYAALLDRLGLTGITVVGNSFGGWVAAELALLASPRVGEVVIVDGIGVEVAPGRREGPLPRADPRALLARPGDVRVPVHVVWGESDRVVDPEYGKAFAAAIPASRFTVLPGTR